MEKARTFTGWGRVEWERLADRLIAGAHRHSSPAGARVVFPPAAGQNATDQLEGFARSFLLAALRIAGSAGSDPALVQWYADALAAGTRCGDAEQWPGLTDHGQPTVEATAIVLGLHFSRPWLWDGLDDGVQARIIHWLSGATGQASADNNHVLFGATIQAFLASVGAPCDRFGIEAALDRIEDWYAGDGWYSDGEGRRFDHYNAWTFQLYPFFILEMLSGTVAAATASAERLRLYRERLEMFLRGYQHLFAAGGSPLIQGRSLIYRWGVVAPFWMGELQGVEALPPGRTRRLASGVARHFTDRGVGDDGVLPLGWWGPRSSILQSYNAPGSPLWAAKGFLGLLLPADHPAWTAPEAALEIEGADVNRVLSGPQWLVQGDHRDDIVKVANFGTGGHPRHDSALYRRLAFSTASAPVQQGSLRDNDLYVPLGDSTSVHRGPVAGVARPGGGSSRFRLDAAGRDVEVDYATALLPDGVELRAARIRGAVAMPLEASGYALAGDTEPESVLTAAGALAAGADGLRSAIQFVGAPEDDTVAATPRIREASGSILGERVAVPVITVDPAAGAETRWSWLVCFTRRNIDLEAVARRLVLHWTPDGLQASDGAITANLSWIRHERWPADAINQGVFGA
ncbi:DUF2264 domain-containing protein [Arthrobacter rhombi]|uniref:DUF2264 domain-containing protein n=1 Tax=Arthrobacter rhombi TaxID=71253 RepID=UPI003FD699DE